VFAIDQNSSTAGNYISSTLGWYSIGLTMTASQVAAFDSALNEYSSALGRP
jgi:hypothetical protein